MEAESNEDQQKTNDKSILALNNAVKYCAGEVKKFDFYSYVAG